MKDYYRILGVADNASDQEIKLAYRRLAKRYHPDVNPGNKRAEEQFKEVADAYNTLSDPILKRAYDLKRMRAELYAGNPSFYYSGPEPEKKKDPRRKEYSREDLSRARKRHQVRTTANMKRRKKLLTGMIITFVIYLGATATFEYWAEKKRQEDSLAMTKALEEKIAEEDATDAEMIHNLDSPYDDLFGKGVSRRFSPNQFVVYNPLSDAVVCVVENVPPFRTIRNEFIHAKNAFVMKEIPDGSFYFKVYTGENWNVHKRIPTGQPFGGFTKNEEFFRIDAGPFVVKKPTYEHPHTNTCDTIVIDPTVMPLRRISQEEFFNTGK